MSQRQCADLKSFIGHTAHSFQICCKHSWLDFEQSAAGFLIPITLMEHTFLQFLTRLDWSTSSAQYEIAQLFSPLLLSDQQS